MIPEQGKLLYNRSLSLFKMQTIKSAGVTVVYLRGDVSIKFFQDLKDALKYMDVMKKLYYRRTSIRIAAEPYPVCSLIPNIKTKKINFVEVN